MSTEQVEYRGPYPRWHDAVAGAAAGAGARLVIAPLDLIRIRMQLQADGCSSMVEIVNQVLNTEGGFRSLFRGNLSATYLWVAYSGVQFGVYGSLSDYLKQTQLVSAPGVAFCAGAGGGVCATLATYPLDLCRTTFAAKGLSAVTDSTIGRPPRTIGEFAVSLYQQKGLGGFFAGSRPAIFGIIPYMGLNFALYDILIKQRTPDNPVFYSGFAGAISGSLSKLAVYPLDTVKKRLQVQAFFLGERQYRGAWDCFHTMARTEGARSLYKGVVPSVIKNAMATSLSFAFFTWSKNSLEIIYRQRMTPI
jgi:solute carrier family 25 (mitochondrial thiamine pyrophosphate transporter), member 19